MNKFRYCTVCYGLSFSLNLDFGTYSLIYGHFFPLKPFLQQPNVLSPFIKCWCYPELLLIWAIQFCRSLHCCRFKLVLISRTWVHCKYLLPLYMHLQWHVRILISLYIICLSPRWISKPYHLYSNITDDIFYSPQ